MEFSWFAIPGIVGGTVAWIGAYFIFKHMPDRKNRLLLSALMFVEGILVWTSYSGVAALFPATGMEAAYPGFLLHSLNDFLVVALYLPTIACLIDTPMLRPFRDTALRYVPVVLGVAGMAALLFGPQEWHIANLSPLVEGYPNMIVTPGPVWGTAFVLLAISYSYGLIATIIAWRRSATELEKRKNGFLALAFGARDLTFVITFVGGSILTAVDPTGEIYGSAFGYFLAYYTTALLSIGLVFYVALAAYGVLSIHMFDIDIKVKWTLSKSTVTAMYIAFFFLVSETSAALLSDQFGLLIGLVATASLLFFIAPIQRWAEQFSDAAMPGVTESPEYVSFRKLQIYGEAIASTLREHNEITSVDRVILNRLSEQLGLSQDEASALESDILAAHT